jgi:hypothetical protein
MPPQNKPSPASKPHGFGSMEITPLNPNSAPIGGPGQPVLRDGAIPAPRPQGFVPPVIAPIDPGRLGMRATPVPVKPNAWGRPGFTGITRA